MSRDRYETVTQFALLIPTSESEAMGEAMLESDSRQFVRAVTLVEIREAAKKLRGAEAGHFDALLSLRGALESGDQLASVRALERLEKAYLLQHADSRVMEHFARQKGLSVTEAIKSLYPWRTRTGAAENTQRVLACEVSWAVGSQLEMAKLVLWLAKGMLRPAIYCPDARTALYVHTFFLAPVAGVGFRICPYDGEQFFQDRPNQEYCCPAHREAHRVARFRDKQKRSGARGKNRRKHGTQKAR